MSRIPINLELYLGLIFAYILLSLYLLGTPFEEWTEKEIGIALFGAMFLFVFLFIIFYKNYISLYIQAATADVKVSFWKLTRMKVRGIDTSSVVINAIRLQQAGFRVPFEDIEKHGTKGDDLSAAVSGMIGAQAAGYRIALDDAVHLQSRGNDVLELVMEGRFDRLPVKPIKR